VKLYSTKAAARLLGVHHGTIFNHIKAGMPAPPLTRTVRRKQKGRNGFNRGGLPVRIWSRDDIRVARAFMKARKVRNSDRLTREYVCRMAHVSRQTADRWASEHLDYNPSLIGWDRTDAIKLKRHAACRLRTTRSVCKGLKIDTGTLRRWHTEGFQLPPTISHPGRARARLWNSKDVARLKKYMARRYRTKYWLRPGRAWAPGKAYDGQ
jgi:DNA-binding XRE family transcriptional regulator